MDVKLFECKGCRKRKQIVKCIRGLQYCEECKDKAPSYKEFQEWKLEKSRANPLFDANVKKRKSGAYEGH